jgi:hypothetical protein
MSSLIVIEHSETGDCACHDCAFGEKAGRDGLTVPQMRADAAEHVIATGHTVYENTGQRTVVRPRDSVDY